MPWLPQVVDRIEDVLGRRGARWTREAHLPGGQFPATGFEAEIAKLKRLYSGLDAKLIRRLARLYGTRATEVLGEARREADLGEHFGADLFSREVDDLVRKEWARSAEDVLWRRTKLGLRVRAEDKARLAAYLAKNG